MKKKIISVISLIMVFTLLPMQPVNAKAGPKLTAKTKNIYIGQSYSLKLKNSPKRAAIKWKTSNKSIVFITRKTGNTVTLKGKKTGKAMITATCKGNAYRCKITVKQKADKSSKKNENTPNPENTNNDKKQKEHPVMNVTSAALYYLPERYKDRIPYYKTHLREFLFRVTGTSQEVETWELVGEDKDFFQITDYGKVTMFWGVTYEYFEKSATVKATLEDGTVVTAMVTQYSEANLYMNQLFDQFKQQYITDDMTELEKAEKVAEYIGEISDYELYNDDWMDIFIEGKGDCMASRCAMSTLCRYIGVRAWACYNLDYHGKTLVRADGVYYMFVTGYDEPRPRSYSMWEVSEEDMEQIVKDNYIWLGES